MTCHNIVVSVSVYWNDISVRSLKGLTISFKSRIITVVVLTILFLFSLILSYFILFHLILFHLILTYSILSHFVSFDLILSYFILFYYNSEGSTPIILLKEGIHIQFRIPLFLIYQIHIYILISIFSHPKVLFTVTVIVKVTIPTELCLL